MFEQKYWKGKTFMKLRQGLARDGPQGKGPQRLQPYLELTLNLVVPHPPPNQKFNLNQLMARWGLGGVGGSKGRCVGSL